MPKQFNEEIAKLKRSNYWSIRERNKVTRLLREKGADIAAVLNQISELKAKEQYDQIKPWEKDRVRFLEEQEALISLQVRLNAEIGETGREILKLRRGIPKSVTEDLRPIKISNVSYICRKLISLRKNQRLIKIALLQWRNMRDSLKANSIIIRYRGTSYTQKQLPWDLATINRRIATYEDDQKTQGALIIKLRDTIAKDPIQKALYKCIIDNIKSSQKRKV